MDILRKFKSLSLMMLINFALMQDGAWASTEHLSTATLETWRDHAKLVIEGEAAISLYEWLLDQGVDERPCGSNIAVIGETAACLRPSDSSIKKARCYFFLEGAGQTINGEDSLCPSQSIIGVSN